ncbi:MAG: thioredoxin domain-containing protein [Chitinophagaceae bacterium]|nr:thioredoxin domain-containing protein [Chitinophagaceae bacterium]
MAVHTNHLIQETSPYLLQHAHNPVNWYPWGDEALQKAREENKPILVSIGYAACHWCHVMERESFEDEATARIMNDHFINIKIDREERPDLDHIYMDAVQAMTGSGGWPLNVFLTPDARPFYGGTYFPPKKAFNRPSWQEVLLSVKQAFEERRHEIDAQAENLTAHLVQSNSFGLQKDSDQNDLFRKDKPDEIFQHIMKSADREWGGFGRAPKFPQTFIIQYLLRYHYVTGNKEALQQALLSLDKMIAGGIYDQAGGGFARYSTDTEWLAPHFEKMLYDNALLVSVLSEAFQLTGHTRYRQVIEETMQFVKRELLHPQMGFYAALDADSEGEEGKFYTWSYEEVKKVVQDDAPLFCQYYDINPKGNWEGKNILRVKVPFEEFAVQHNISAEQLAALLNKAKEKLLAERNKRERPLLDDKIILGWNALMNTACSKACMATGNGEYKKLAIDNMTFLLDKFRDGNTGRFFHTWKNGQAKYPAFLDDYAFLIEALIHLQEVTADQNWLIMAADIVHYVTGHFSEPDTGFFYYTGKEQQDVIIRKKEVYDGAVPSGNSIMAYNLYRLSILLDRPDWKARSMDMLSSIGVAVSRYPVSFGIWSSLLQEIVAGTFEIAVVGAGYEKLMKKISHVYLPHRVLTAASASHPGFPLLSNKALSDYPLIYLCKDYVCQQPVDSIERFMSLINREKITD